MRACDSLVVIVALSNKLGYLITVLGVDALTRIFSSDVQRNCAVPSSHDVVTSIFIPHDILSIGRSSGIPILLVIRFFLFVSPVCSINLL